MHDKTYHEDLFHFAALELFFITTAFLCVRGLLLTVACMNLMVGIEIHLVAPSAFRMVETDVDPAQLPRFPLCKLAITLISDPASLALQGLLLKVCDGALQTKNEFVKDSSTADHTASCEGSWLASPPVEFPLRRWAISNSDHFFGIQSPLRNLSWEAHG